MKWLLKDPSPGDMIRVALGGIYHVGVYVSDDEVIQFGLAPTRRSGLRDEDIEVLSSDIDTFLAGGFLEVCEFEKKEAKKNRKPKEIIKYARSKIGTRGYNILYNNCEHFATECVTGTAISHQTEGLRAMFRSLPIADLYIAAIPDTEPTSPLSSPEREAEIASVGNEKVRREKYYVFKLLEYALERSFGAKPGSINLHKNENGKWVCDSYELSLSHSHGMLAVAVSRAPIGVDIEAISAPRSEKMAERIMTEEELSVFSSLDDKEKEAELISTWCRKEAIFKSLNEPAFYPSKIDTKAYKTVTRTLDTEDARYVWVVATATPERLRVFDGIKL